MIESSSPSPAPGVRRFDCTLDRAELFSGLQVHHSTTLDDPEWDAFLESVPSGEYQQSSMWAQTKAADGWQCSRTILSHSNGTITGGFQILHRRKRGIRLGYLMRGPVTAGDAPVGERFQRLVAESARHLRLTALLVQTPHEDGQQGFSAHPYLAAPARLGIITASVWIDVSAGVEALHSAMFKSTLNRVRSSIRKGVVIRNGTRDDLPLFFQLMKSTCERQGVAPNPGNLPSLEALWDTFSCRNRVWLRFGSVNGEIISGWLCLLFGKRVMLFKTGWNGKHADTHPNVLQIYDLLRESASAGLTYCDFTGLNPSLAAALKEKRPLTDEDKRSRDFYKLGYGGFPVFYSPPSLYIANPMLRALYRMIADRKPKQLHCPSPVA